MHTLLKNKNAYGKIGVSLFSIMLFASFAVFGQISVPGTGRGALGFEDPHWFVYGKWNTVAPPNDEISAQVIRTGTTDQFCNTLTDHEVSASAEPPEGESGGGYVYFAYPFTVTQSGTYSTNNFTVSSNLGVELVRSLGDFNKELIVADNSTHSACAPYSFTASLTAGNYEIRIKKFINANNDAVITVSSTGGNSGSCVPAVQMTSTSIVSINSGETINIPLTSTVASTYSWATAGNPNTNVTSMESGTTSPITKTITNSTATVQTLIYTVTPTSITGSCVGLTQTITVIINPPCISGCDVVECTDCIGSFAPATGATYKISAWVQESNNAQEMTYAGPALGLTFTGGTSLSPFVPSGPIIDGWQRIDGTFTVPSTATEVFVKLINTGNNKVYFDDLRIQPLKASLKSFVYDPVSMRLMAELDENNYATFYEYDEEGALIRVKKETERGVKTIKETGNNTRKP